MNADFCFARIDIKFSKLQQTLIYDSKIYSLKIIIKIYITFFF